jgi:hypothetical protein
MKTDYLLIDEIMTDSWLVLCNIILSNNISYNCYTVNSNIYLKLTYKTNKKLDTLLHEFYYYNNVESITKKAFYENVSSYDNADYLITR